MVWLLGHLLSAGLLATLVWLPGAALLPEHRQPAELGRLGSLVRWCLGLATWTVLLFIQAAIGLLEPRWLAVVVAVGSLVGIWRRRHQTPPDSPPFDLAAPDLETPAPVAPASRRSNRIHAFRFAALAVLLVPIWIVANAPTISWDASTYHLTLPKLYLEHGGFRPVELNVYSYWPLGTELLFALALSIHDAVTAKLVHFGMGLLTLAALIAGCRRFAPVEHRSLATGLAVLAFLANGVVLFEMRVAYVDLAQAFFFTTALLLLLCWLDGLQNGFSQAKGCAAASTAPDDRLPTLDAARWLPVLAGVAAGLAAGTKLSGIAGVVLLTLLLLPSLRTLPAPRRALGTLLVSFVGTAMVLWLPWPIRSALTTGNPVYPALHSVFGGPDWSPELAKQLANWQSSIGMGRDPLDYLLLPWRVAVEGGRGYPQFDGASTPLWLLLLPGALWQARHDRFVRRCLGAAGLFFAFWALTSQQMRLLIPAFPALALAVGCGNAALIHQLSKQRRRWVTALALGIAWLAVAWQVPWQTSGGVVQRLLIEDGDLMESAVPPVFLHINRELPDTARLLMLNTNQRFFCEREVLADSFFEASQIAAWLAPAGDDLDALGALLQERGVTHLLLDQRPLGIPFPPALDGFLRDPRRVRPQFQSPDGRYVVFEVLPR